MPSLFMKSLSRCYLSKLGRRFLTDLHYYVVGILILSVCQNCHLMIYEALAHRMLKQNTFRIVTDAVIAGKLNFDDLAEMSDSEVIRKLTSYRGIGNWTAKMYLIFVLGRQDVLPFEDGAFLQSYRWLYKTEDCTAVAVKKRCQKWKPYSSIAARYLYRVLDLGMTKEEFHLYK